MDFKKFISGISALTIAASAFAGMAVTASAAETTTTFDFEDGNAVFTGDSRITVAIEDNTDLSSKVVGFTCAGNAQNGYSFAHYDFSSLVSDATAVKVEFDYYNTNGGRAIVTLGDASTRGTTGNSGKTAYSSDGAAFWLGSNKNNSILNGKEYALTNYTGKWMHVTVNVNEVTNKYSYTITSSGSELATASDVSFTGNVSQIDLFGYINNSHCAMIDNLSITSTVDESVQSANYTVKYVDANNNQLKDASVRSNVVGNPVEITANDTANFTADGQKYIYVSNDAEGKTVAEDGSTVVTVLFRAAATYNYTVASNVGSYVVTGSGFEGNSATVPYPEYVVVDGTAYKKGQISNQFNYSFTLDSDNKEETLAYTADKENVVYYEEGESAFTKNNVANAGVRCSMGEGGDVSNETATTVTTLPAGKYKITAAVWGGGRDDNTQSTYSFKIGDSEVYAISTTGSRVETTSDEFTLNEATELTVIKSVAGTAGACIDLVLIQKNGDVEKQNDMAFTFNKSISELANKAIIVHRSADTKTATISELIDDNGTVYSGEGNVKLAIIFTNIPAEWGTLSLTLE